jgi:amidase
VKSLERVEESLAKIRSIDHDGYKLNSVIALTEDAIEHARFLEKNNRDLPLQGLPILIKDNIEVQGLPATAGSLALVNTPIQKDSTIAQRLREAGAVIIGATNLSEWANIRSTKSTSGWSAVGGLTANPWIHGHSAGGSSSGSGAAVAAGLTQWSIGSETDGSIICPASLNGCVGIKPTVGAIPRDGMIPISESQDSPGPMSQTVEQAALLLDVLTNKDEYLKAAYGDEGLKVGVVKQWISEDSKLGALFEETLQKLERNGVTLVEVELTPPTDSEQNDELLVLLYELVGGLRAYLSNRQGASVSSLKEILKFNLENSEIELEHFGQELFEMALQYEDKGHEYKEARKRNLMWAEDTLAKGLASADVLMGCTYGPAWKSDLANGDKFEGSTWITTAPAIAGTPIGTIPMGLVEGLPVGLGFVSGRNHEDRLIKAMSRAERALNIGVMTPTFLK